MKKWIFTGLGVIVVVIAAVVIIGLSNLGPIIKHAVNTYGPKITKTQLSVDDVGVSIFSAEANLKKLFLGNPQGFKSPSAMKVGSVFVNVDEGSLKNDTIVIDSIEVKGPEITYEKRGKTDNFKQILTNVTKSASSEKSSKKEAEEQGAGKKLIIRNFVVKNGKVNLSMSAYGIAEKDFTATLPDIQLKDIGKKQNGATPAEVFKEVLAALYGQITSPAVINSLNQELKALGLNLNSLEDVTKKATDLAGGSGKVGEGLQDVGKKVKGILGGN
ncbi:MAG: AsmA family protein [Desulfobacterales bacterium]